MFRTELGKNLASNTRTKIPFRLEEKLESLDNLLLTVGSQISPKKLRIRTVVVIILVPSGTFLNCTENVNVSSKR